MENEEFLISVILPVYNCEKYIFNSINSILIQSYKNLELLIIDDGSTDKTANLIKKFKDKRIKYFKKDHKGLLKSLIFGLNNAKGSFIARMDADDISHPDRIKIQLELLLEKRSDICGCGFYTINSYSHLKRSYNVPITKNDIKIRLSSSVPFCHGSILAKTSLFKNFPYDSGENKVVEDYSLWIKMYDSGVKFSNTEKKLYFLREHSESLSKIDRNNFKRISLSLSLDFISKNQKALIKILESKSLLDFSLMSLNSICIDYLYILIVLSKIHSIYKPHNRLLILLILVLKSLIYKIISFIERRYNSIFIKYIT